MSLHKSKRNLLKTNRLFVSFFILLAVLIAPVFVSTQKDTQAASFAQCDTNGILYQYPNGTDTQVHLIDMVTGSDSYDTSPVNIDGRTINAIGYNVVDNFVYGWDNTADTLVRIHSDSTVEELTINGFTTTTNIIIGDVDENGYYWFIVGSGQNGQTYHAVDVSTGGTTVDLVPGIGTGTVSGIPADHSAGADWAYVPGGTGLYRVMHDAAAGPNQSTGHLLVFDRDTGAFSSVGHIPTSQLPSHDLKEGAFYADVDGFLYASDNDDGNIYRVDVSTATATLFANGPSSGSNDGARCANAPIPIDFGDAPDTYDTLLASDGSRHGVVGFNEADSTAPLMLGEKIDIETDGFPGAEAKGDDTNNIDDEDGVSHIVATPGTPTALSIPVTVTNNNAGSATLAGWVDLDSDGAFDVGERVTATIPANSGTAVYQLDFPTATFTDDSFARFRVFEGTVADPQPTGSATGGEVEDVLVQVGTYEIEKTSTPADGSNVAPGDTVTYRLNITNTGLTDLIGLMVQDDLKDVLDDATLVGTPVIDPASAGTANVDNSALEFIFTGDILAGQSVTITYSVKVNEAGALSNSVLNNMVIAAHSNCHPNVSSDQTVSVSDANCSTEHHILGGLANTGNNALLLLLLATGFIGSGTVLLVVRSLVVKRGSGIA